MMARIAAWYVSGCGLREPLTTQSRCTCLALGIALNQARSAANMANASVPEPEVAQKARNECAKPSSKRVFAVYGNLVFRFSRASQKVSTAMGSTSLCTPRHSTCNP